MKKKLLLINPPIHDFSAYNLWARPLGLLYLVSLFKKVGFDIDFIDCLSLDYENMLDNNKYNYEKSKNRFYATYNYFKEEIEKPAVYKKVRRKYYRHGINPDLLKKLLSGIKKKPDAVLVSSMMTYWYTGVFETIKIIKEFYPGVPVILGGLYANLCHDHAVKHSNADHVINNNNFFDILKLLCGILNYDDPLYSYKKIKIKPEIFSTSPELDVYKKNNFIPILTSIGCNFKCKYCASNHIHKKYYERPFFDILDEILYWKQKFDFNDVAFFDDALLFNKEKRIKPFLKRIIEMNLKLNFHTPNGINLRFIDRELADLMILAGFKSLRFGLETSIKRIQMDSGSKIDNNEFERVIKILFDAGFTNENISVYILMGLPRQDPVDVLKTIDYAKHHCVKPKLCEYSPIPFTDYFNESRKSTFVDILNEPLYHNNTTLSLWNPDFNDEIINDLKLYMK